MKQYLLPLRIWKKVQTPELAKRFHSCIIATTFVQFGVSEPCLNRNQNMTYTYVAWQILDQVIKYCWREAAQHSFGWPWRTSQVHGATFKLSSFNILPSVLVIWQYFRQWSWVTVKLASIS